MNKKKKNFELKIYEILGVKSFRKKVLWLYNKICTYMSKEISVDKRVSNNYQLGKVNSLEDIKKFKRKIFFNVGVHTFALLLAIPGFLAVVAGNALLVTTILTFVNIVLNTYCLMLQRYNIVKINQLIEKMTPRYEKQKETIKEELRKEDALLIEHTYKRVEKKGERNITLEELIADANIEELKQYRKHLECFKQMIQENDNSLDEKKINIVISTKKHKCLKLELKPNEYNKNIL